MLAEKKTDGLVVQEIGDELLIYDERRGRAHNLNAVAALVWRHCDSETTVDDLVHILREKTQQPVDARVVHLALKRLQKAGLIQVSEKRSKGGITRREILGRFLAVAGARLMLPLVVSTTVAQSPVQAQESAGCGTLTSNCPSGYCQPGHGSCVAVSPSGTCGCSMPY